MLLVLFAVVLGLPASQGEGFSLADNRCYLFLMHTGKEYCQLLGYDTFDGLIPKTCDLVCGGPTVKLPKKACPNRSMQLAK
uniref:Putative ixodes 10 kDa peptide protein n=1 Tax=Ixodes ricinus TaxID=34613 RepID=A0A0K8R6A9_IXORI